TEQSPAGQALIADANERVANLDVRTRFPVRLSWLALIVPGSALLLGLVAYFYDPSLSTAETLTPKPKQEQQFVPAQEVNQDINNLKKLTKTKWFENLPPEDKRELERRIKELEQMKLDSLDQQREAAQKIQSVKNDIKDMLDEKKAEDDKRKEE